MSDADIYGSVEHYLEHATLNARLSIGEEVDEKRRDLIANLRGIDGAGKDVQEYINYLEGIVWGREEDYEGAERKAREMMPELARRQDAMAKAIANASGVQR